jgi:hypothetical protein
MSSNASIATDKGDTCTGDLLLPLPPADTERWVPRRKAAVVAGVRTGIISRKEACERYLLSPEELAAWETAFDQNGIPGLRVTRAQYYREPSLDAAMASAPPLDKRQPAAVPGHRLQ